MLEDKRVDLDIEDEDGKTIENMLPKDIDPLKISRANKIFKAARTRQDTTATRNKVAVLVINTNYSKLTKLEGPLKDLQIAKQVFVQKGYKIFTIENSEDIFDDVRKLIENEGLNQSDVFQFFYSGHGIHKTSAEKGIFQGETQKMTKAGTMKETNYGQEGELGDCLVNTNSTLCEELYLSLMIANELKEDASMCFFYDMCRDERKVSS